MTEPLNTAPQVAPRPVPAGSPLTFRHLVFFAVVCGAFAGWAVHRYRLSQQLVAEPQPWALQPTGRSTPLRTVAQPRTESGRFVAPAAGLSLELPSSCSAKQVLAGINRIVRVTQGRELVLVYNSAPVYPWMDLPALSEALGGVSWSSGNVVLDDLGLSLPFAGEAWAWRGGRNPELLLVAHGRQVSIRAPGKDGWKRPEVKQLLTSYQPRAGADLRSVYLGLHPSDAERADRPPSNALRQLLREGIEELGAELLATQVLAVRRGVSAFRQDTLDHLDALILRDLLKPALRKLRMKRKADEGPSADCGAGAAYRRGPEGDPSAAPFPPVEPQLHGRASSLVEARAQADATIFRDEVEAQRHERTLTRLWDSMMQSEDAFAVLGALPCERLRLGTPGPAEALDALGVTGVVRRVLGQPLEELSGEEARARLRAFADAGWVIEQSEWHHEQFFPAGEGTPPRSLVNVELHALLAAEQRRVIVRGRLGVVWSGVDDAGGYPLPRELEATELELFERAGPLPFAEVLRVDAVAETGHSAMYPVILQDRSGDGLSEILLPTLNLEFHNQGEGRFTRGELFPKAQSLQMAGLLADLTGDARADYVTVQGQDLVLFEADAEGRFATPARRILRALFRLPSTITAGDIDGDGDLDLFVAQYRLPYREGVMPTPFYDARDGYPAFLLRNQGGGRFEDVTEAAGLGAKRTRRTYSASFADLDGDHDQDLVVVSDFAGVDLYANDGQGHFEDVSSAWLEQPRLFGMGHSFADYDRDGRLDLYVLGMASTTARRLMALGIEVPGHEAVNAMRGPMSYGNRMFLARQDGLSEPPWGSQVARTGWSWGVVSPDLDNDGDADLYISNGHRSGQSTEDYCTRFWSHDIYSDTRQANPDLRQVFDLELGAVRGGATSWNGYEKNPLLVAGPGPSYLNLAYLLGVAFQDDARAVLADDIDGDGQQDLLVSLIQRGQGPDRHRLVVLRNRGLGAGRHWIGVRLAQGPGGVSPIGAQVTAQVGERRYVAQVVTGDSHAAQHAPTVHFGLGAQESVERLEVRWLDGRTQVLETPAVDRYHRLVSGKE